MSEQPKRKILFISDHPLYPSGVGVQAKFLIEGLLDTGRYTFRCFGGALRHQDYRPQQVGVEKWGERAWVIIPVDGHGNKELLRQMLYLEKPDAVVIFTDPRFFYWVWEMEDEIRQCCPLLYWHVWDNDPIPDFNRIFYESTDHIACLSLKTYGIMQGLGLDQARYSYIPHGLPADLFKPLPENDVQAFKRANFGPHAERPFIVFWNNRNARRKQTGDVMESFSLFLKRVGKQNAALMMHTDPRDQEGQDIFALARLYGIEENLIVSTDKVEAGQLNWFYNACDVTINISSNEGFGLGTLESLFAGTPIVAHFTGGLQFQLGTWWKGMTRFDDQDFLTESARRQKKTADWWGVPVFPKIRSCVGSQQVPYIYDDRVDNEEVGRALEQLYRMSRSSRRKLGEQARAWALENFSLTKMVSDWDSRICETIDGTARGPRKADVVVC